MRKKLLFFILFVLMITGIAVGIHDYFHWQVMLTTETFTESTEKIWNPESWILSYLWFSDFG